MANRNRPHTNETIHPAIAQAAGCDDDELLTRIQRLAAKRRNVVTELLVYLAEIDGRKLYARFATGSMFAFCIEKLGLSEPSVYRYIAAARLAKRYPRALTMLQQGQLHLSAIALLSKHIADDNSDELLSLAAGKSKRKLEQQLAALFPQPDVPTTIRKLPEKHRTVPARTDSTPTSAESTSEPPRADEPTPTCPQAELTERSAKPLSDGQLDATVAAAAPAQHQPPVKPLAKNRYRVQFTASTEFVGKLEQAQALFGRQTHPAGLVQLLELALDQLIAQKMKNKFALTDKPRCRRKKPAVRACGQTKQPASEPARDAAPCVPVETNPRRTAAAAHAAKPRRLPAAAHAAKPSSPAKRPAIEARVKRAVFQRDGLRCTYTDEHGKRCKAIAQLEFHHRKPFAHGGPCSVDNLTLRCRAHNQHQARSDFGPETIDRAVANNRRARQLTVADARKRFALSGEKRLAPSGAGPSKSSFGDGHELAHPETATCRN